jgi:inner membrane protein YidH
MLRRSRSLDGKSVASRGKIHIGISGRRYPGWRGVFYPERLAQRRELEFASRQFDTIELNGSFYSLQRPESFSRWHADSYFCQQGLPLYNPHASVGHPGDTIPPMDKPAEQDPRVYFAAERTFLAWIRTGLGLMGVGFAVSRFGLFLRELSASASHLPAQTTGLSLWSGVMLVALGVIVTLSAVVRHVQLVSELRSGSWRAGRVSTDAVILGLLLAAMGIAMALYLTLVR